MTPERFRQVEAVLAGALERPPEERAAYLDVASAGDPDLRREVESLLEGLDTAGFLDGDLLSWAAPILAPGAPGGLAGERVGPYRLERLLGAGGMGEVYLAHDERLDRRVALKLLAEDLAAAPEWRDRFLREARLASALDHPNVCTIHDVGEADGRAFIAMQHVDGRTLREVAAGGPLPTREWLPLALQVAEALAAAHERGIVHRDVKPGNAVVTPRGQVKVLDFGIAKRLAADGAAGDGTQTGPGLVLGTPGAMSPEQARGQAADARSDVFSFGLLAYELATGRNPFAAGNPADALAALLAVPHRPASEVNPAVPPAISAVLDRALAKDPAARYATMGALLGDLRRAAADLGDAEPSGEPGARRRRGASVMASAAALALVAAGIVALATLRRDPPPAAPPEAGATAPGDVRMRRLTTIGTAAAAAISPDGRYIAYARGEAVATGYRPRWPAGRSSLWVAQLATGSAVEIAAPADRLYKGTTFSPDGQHLYFTAVDGDEPLGALYRVPALGGTPRRLLQRIESAIAVSPDGRRVAFVRHDPLQGADSLVVADAEGGGERILATRRGADWFEEDGLAWSPDGARLALFAGSDAGGTHMTVVTVPAAGGEPRAVTTRRWTTGGRVAWGAEGKAIFAIGADEPDTTNVGTTAQIWRIAVADGSATRVTHDLSGYSQTSLGVTADGGSLIAVREDASARLWAIDLDEGGPQPPRRVGSGALDGRSGLDWTPDGGLVYVASSGGGDDLWLAPADGSPPRPLTDQPGAEQSPVVSPDGTQVLFRSTGSGTQQIWRLRLDRRAPPQRLTADPVLAAEPSWSPDGTWLAFSSWRGGSTALWRMPIAGEPAVRLTTAPAARPSVSPDGSRIACSYFTREPAGSRWRLAVIPAAGGEPLQVLPLSHETVNTTAGLWWTPDGRSVVDVDTPRGVSNVWRLGLDGGPPEPLTRFETGQIFSLALSRDGRRLAVSRGTIEADVVLVQGLR